MNQERTISDVAAAILGSILEDPLWVIARIVPWCFVAIAAPLWVTAVLLCGIVVGPFIFDPVIGVLHRVRWGFDAVLFLLGWMSLHTVFGSWIVATVIMAAYLGFFYWKRDQITKRPKGPVMSIFQASETKVDPTAFVHRIVALTDQTLAHHGWTQREVLRNNTEFKRYQYKARLNPAGIVEIICFDDEFPGDASYPFPLLGDVDISLDLPGASTATVGAVFDEIYAEAQAAFPGVSQMKMEQA